MEDVLDAYHLPYDKDCPLICMDEKPYQLLADAHEPIPMQKGKPQRVDDEYARHGVCSIFVFTEPLTGYRHVSVRERRTRSDWAYEVAYLLEVLYPKAPQVRLVCDNLNTHTLASLYVTFPPEKARQLAKRLLIHYTPKHGSWLNIAEIELSVMSHQCLKRRISSIDALRMQLGYWESRRNALVRGVKWQFTTSDARIKLKRLYPVLEMDTSSSIIWIKP